MPQLESNINLSRYAIIHLRFAGHWSNSVKIPKRKCLIKRRELAPTVLIAQLAHETEQLTINLLYNTP